MCKNNEVLNENLSLINFYKLICFYTLAIIFEISNMQLA